MSFHHWQQARENNTQTLDKLVVFESKIVVAIESEISKLTHVQEQQTRLHSAHTLELQKGTKKARGQIHVQERDMERLRVEGHTDRQLRQDLDSSFRNEVEKMKDNELAGITQHLREIIDRCLNTSVKYLARLKYVLDKSQGKLASCRTDDDCVDMLYMDIVSREIKFGQHAWGGRPEVSYDCSMTESLLVSFHGPVSYRRLLERVCDVDQKELLRRRSHTSGR
jgi:hypothetical protein